MKKYLSLLLSACICISILAGCGSDSSSGNDSSTTTKASSNSENSTSDEPYTIAVMPKLMGIAYFNSAQEGAEKAGEDLGVKVIYTGPTEADAADQVKMLEDLINSGVDAICVAPNDPAAMESVFKKAREAGVLVLDWDTPADINLVDASIHQIEDEEYAKAFWDELVEHAGTDDMDYAIITGGLSAENLNTWIKIGREYAAEKYPNLNLVTDPIPDDEKQQEAYKITLDLIKAYPNLKGIIGFGTPTPLGSGQAVREKGLNDKLTIVGTAVEADVQEYLEDGAVDAGLLWDPSKLGYLSVAVAKTMLDDIKLTDGMEIEGFGTVAVKEDGKTVVMGVPDVYEKSN